MGKKMRQINAALPQGLAYQSRVCGSALVNLHVLASLARGLAYPGNGRRVPVIISMCATYLLGTNCKSMLISITITFNYKFKFE